MRSAREVSSVQALAAAGHSASSIARLTGIPRATVRDWMAGRVPGCTTRSLAPWMRPVAELSDLLALPPEYAYLLGLYLGDGTISAHPRDVFRLRIFLDLSYPGIVDECERAMRLVLPDRSVSRLNRGGSFAPDGELSNVEVSVYAKCLPRLFPNTDAG